MMLNLDRFSLFTRGFRCVIAGKSNLISFLYWSVHLFIYLQNLFLSSEIYIVAVKPFIASFRYPNNLCVYSTFWSFFYLLFSTFIALVTIEITVNKRPNIETYLNVGLNSLS